MYMGELALGCAALVGAAIVAVGILVARRLHALSRLRPDTPAELEAVILSLDAGSQSWVNVYALVCALRNKGFHLALVTSAARNDFERTNQGAREILDQMSTIVAGDEVGRIKPHADLYLEAARRLRVVPARCLVFDDAADGGARFLA